MQTTHDVYGRAAWLDDESWQESIGDMFDLPYDRIRIDEELSTAPMNAEEDEDGNKVYICFDLVWELV